MILSDLLSVADRAGDLAGVFRVLVATRTIDGVEMGPGQAQISEAGELQVDMSGGDLDILPTRFMEPAGAGLTVSDFRRLAAEQPEAVELTLTGVTGFKHLEGGGAALRTEQVLGTYIPKAQNEIWLLLYPEQQWPQHWFGA
ncbi:hypothetical protein ACFFGH_34245 [Lysobacter korlensis]|uniref:Uncharacterized protein n=1 Tax=Lysobacter korlensis TaxID=553636 RepID=A0ABV6S2F8_9GAMM